MNLLDAGVIKTDAKATLADRMCELADDVWALLAEHAPAVVVIELPAKRGQYHNASPIYAATYGLAVGSVYAGWVAWTANTGRNREGLELVAADSWCKGYARKGDRLAQAEAMVGTVFAGAMKARRDIADAVLLADWCIGRRGGKVMAFDPAMTSTGWAVAEGVVR